VQFGSYKILGELGAGGMGVVYKGLDRNNLEVAIKMIGNHADIRGTVLLNRLRPQHQAFDSARRMMFVREASLAMQLNHQNIVRVFDYGRHEGLLYIVMEYLPGHSLEKLIALRVSMSLGTRLSFMIQLCEALDYAHRHGVIHRDVKPLNVIVLKGIRLKVLDFGLAGRLGAQSSGNTFAGTPSYAAPELFAGSGNYDARADIWAAGITFYKLLTGRLPFTGTYFDELRNNVLYEPLPRLDKRIPHAEELERILDRALAKDPRQRHSSAADLLRELRRLQDQLGKSREDADGVPEQSVASSAGGKTTSSKLPTSGLSPSYHVSVSSGEMQSRSANHTLRANTWNDRAFVFALLGFTIACLYPLAYRADSLGDYSLISQQNSVFLGFLSYVCGVMVPASLFVGAALVLPAFLQQISEVPHCRRCSLWMRYQFQEIRLAGTDVDWTHARDDCVAALKEDLWGDAAKLLSLREEMKAPVEPESNMRFRLDFFTCVECGDENAVFNTDYGGGAHWKAAEEYSSAYRSPVDKVNVRQIPLTRRVHTIVGAVDHAFTLAIGRMHPFYMALCLVAAYFCANFYYPQIPQIFGLPIHRTTITILVDPPDIPIIVDGTPTKTPAKFAWYLSSKHTIDTGSGWLPRTPFSYFNGHKVDIFATRDGDRRPQGVPSPSGRGRVIIINPLVNNWGKLESIPAISSFTVGSAVAAATKFAPPVTDPSPPTVIVTSKPEGLAVIVDGSSVLTPSSFSWEPDSTHTLTALSGLQISSHRPSGLAPNARVYYNLGRWNPTKYAHAMPKRPSGVEGQTIVIKMPPTPTAQPIVVEARFNRIVMPAAQP
jgi:serine/threonine protein kinase